MAECRSCKNGMETFKKLQNSVKYIGNVLSLTLLQGNIF